MRVSLLEHLLPFLTGVVELTIKLLNNTFLYKILYKNKYLYDIREIRENYDKATKIQKQLENKSFLTNDTKTTQETTHK